ncbi:hypothetical protein TNCV_3838761 [Trichonephila clavipes]|nr:hypothetical protein TNCV_3838761 [Trichonephila clavipes]
MRVSESPEQPIGVSVHFTQQPIREQPLSSPLCQKIKQLFRPDEEPNPRLPDLIVRSIAVMPLSRMQNCTFAMSNITDYPDMGLRTVVTVQMPKIQRLETFKDVMEQRDLRIVIPHDFCLVIRQLPRQQSIECGHGKLEDISRDTEIDPNSGVWLHVSVGSGQIIQELEYKFLPP